MNVDKKKNSILKNVKTQNDIHILSSCQQRMEMTKNLQKIIDETEGLDIKDIISQKLMIADHEDKICRTLLAVHKIALEQEKKTNPKKTIKDINGEIVQIYKDDPSVDQSLDQLPE